MCNNVTDVKSKINFFNRGLFPSLDKQEKLYIESCQELETIRKKLTEIAVTVPKLATKSSIENDTVINTWKTDKSGVFLKLTNARSTKLKAHFMREKSIILHYRWKSNFDKSEKFTKINTGMLQFKSVSGAASSDKKITCDKLTTVYDTILQSTDNLNEELDIQFKKFLKKLNSYFREIDLIVK